MAQRRAFFFVLVLHSGPSICKKIGFDAVSKKIYNLQHIPSP